MKKKAGIQIKIFISIVAVLFISGSIVFFTKAIEKEMRTQLQHSMQDVANQNVTALQNQINSNELLLDGIISELVNADNPAETVQKYKNFVEKYGLKRLGYCQTDGMTISTDGAVVDLSHRDFFQKGMQGEAYISEVLYDAMDEKHSPVCVISKPMWDANGEIFGVGCITYDLTALNSVLDMDCFEGQGYSFAVNEAGEIMVRMGNTRMELSENLFDEILHNPENEEIFGDVQEKMKRKEIITGEVFLFEQEYFYATPVELMGGKVTWYMITMVPKKQYDQHFNAVRRNLYYMDAVVIAVLLIGCTMIVYVSTKQRQESLRAVYTDPITKGANYAKLCQVVSRFRGRKGYLLSVDIRNFKNINIAAGRKVGNQMIVKFWKAFEQSTRAKEMVARVRDDEFAIYIDGRSREELLSWMEQVTEEIHQLAKEIQIPNVYPLYGICQIKENESVEDAFEKARIARDYISEERDKNYVFFDEVDHNQFLEDQKLEERFEEAVSTGEFVVWYQPKYSVKNKGVVGSEALVRWIEKDGNMISPGRFIPLFEKDGFISRLDEYMFRSVCMQQKKWLEAGYQILPVSVNLSKASLYHTDIVEKYQEILEEYQLDSKYVQIEITESVMEGSTGIVQMLGKFRTMGIRVLMDDFGTGYSSLATLGMSCFDTLKLDKSLIDHIGEETGETMLAHIVSMGKNLGLHITAEGVEKSVQFDYLEKIGCDDIQGFLFAKPMPSEDFEKLLP